MKSRRFEILSRLLIFCGIAAGAVGAALGATGSQAPAARSVVESSQQPEHTQKGHPAARMAADAPIAERIILRDSIVDAAGDTIRRDIAEIDRDSIGNVSIVGDSISSPIKTAPTLPQGKVSAVDYDREKPVQPGLHYYDKHGEPLQTPVRFLAELDTVVKVKSKPVYPAFNGVSIGANFFDGIMMLVGQQRANFDIWADFSIFNWFYPVVEAGVGFANARPDDNRFHFNVKPSFYAKIGLNYNFLYKSSPDYQVFVGLRAGFSSFNYDITGIQPGSDYYVENGPVDVYGLHSTSWHGEALAGLKVKLWSFISMGWTFRYGFGFKQTYSNADYPAWFTPGKGTSSPISASFSLIFTIGRKKIDPATLNPAQ